jgi:hypothetical protein
MRQVYIFGLCLFVSSCLLLSNGNAQQKHINKAAKRKAQVERDYKKAYARARKSTIKHRYEIQTKATQDMMDAADKRAEAFNRQNKPRFLERVFKRKRPKRR